MSTNEDRYYAPQSYLQPVVSTGVMEPVKWAAQFISDMSLHVVREDYEALEKIKARSDEVGGIRATLLVNFGADSKHNRYGMALKDEGTTHGLLMQVLEHLTKTNEAARIAELERLNLEAQNRIGDLCVLIGNIEQCRSVEGDSVTVLCDNPEADSVETQGAVEVCGDYTGYELQRFYGKTWEEALAKAARVSQRHYQNDEDVYT